MPPSAADFATLIGEGIELEEVAEHAGTIGYEVLTSLGHRYARIYKSGESLKQHPAPCSEHGRTRP